MRRILIWWYRRRLRNARSVLLLMDALDDAGCDSQAQYFTVNNPWFVRKRAMANQVEAIHRLKELGDTTTDLTRVSTAVSPFLKEAS